MAGQVDNRIFLGAWKQFYDGSPQGYTALFKRPGYWDKQGQNGFDPETNQDLVLMVLYWGLAVSPKFHVPAACGEC